MRRLYLSVEWTTLYVFIPLLILFGFIPKNPIPTLLIGAGIAWMLLHQDKSFDGLEVYKLRLDSQALRQMLVRFFIAATAITISVLLFMPTQAFSFPLQRPKIWLLVMILYPIFSVYPQELLFRVLHFHRYRELFPSKTLSILLSAASFGFVHIIMGNVLAVLMSFIGGLLFAWTYTQTRSLLLVVLEHALFGQLIFTVGLGRFFYHGA